MRFAKIFLTLGLALVCLATTVKADFTLNLSNNGKNQTSLNSWDGSAFSYQGLTFSATDSDTATKGSLVVTITGLNTGRPVTFNVYDNNDFTKLSSDKATFSVSAVPSNPKELQALSFSGQVVQASTPYQSNNNSWNQGDGTNTNDVSSLTLATKHYNLTQVGGNINFSASGSEVLTAEVDTKKIPEPTSILIGLVGIPCMGGLVRLARRKAKA